MKKRILSMLIAVMIVIGMLPVGTLTALATETTNDTVDYIAWQDANGNLSYDEGEATFTTLKEALNTGGYIMMAQNYTATSEVDSYYGLAVGDSEATELLTVTLDLNNKLIRFEEDESTGTKFKIYNTNFTLTDSSSDSSGCVGSSSDAGATLFAVYSGSCITVKEGIINSEGDAFYIKEASAQFLGGHVTAADCAILSRDSTLLIEGGLFQSENTAGACMDVEGGVLTIKDGYFYSGGYDTIRVADATVEITGGQLNDGGIDICSLNVPVTATVTGGSFDGTFGISISENVSLTVNGAMMNTTGENFFVSGTLTVRGGYYDSENENFVSDKGNVTVYGGSFSSKANTHFEDHTPDVSTICVLGGYWLSENPSAYIPESYCAATNNIGWVVMDTHTYDGEPIITAPTCSSEGAKTITCSRCGTSTHEPIAINPENHKRNEYGYCEYCQVKLTGASITAGVDLTMEYYVGIYDEALLENGQMLAMQFTMNGNTVTIAEYTEVNGEYVFAFEGIAPQCMADLIDAALVVLDGDGTVVKTLAVKEDYSVKANAEALLAQYPSDARLTQLIADMLTYGAAAQNYKDYNLDNLANAGITSIPSEALPTDADNVKQLTTEEGVTIGNVYFTSATVWFDNVNKIGIKLSTIENVKLKVNGQEVTLTGTTYYTDAISATEFDKVFTFELYEGDTLVQTLTYSVSSYVYAMINKVDGADNPTEMAELAKALYCYGASAVAFKDIGEEITDEHANALSTDGETFATYDASVGWTGVYDDALGECGFFLVQLNAGDVVTLKFSDDTRYYLTRIDVSSPDITEYDSTAVTIHEITGSGLYALVSYSNVTVRAYVTSAESAD